MYLSIICNVCVGAMKSHDNYTTELVTSTENKKKNL